MGMIDMHENDAKWWDAKRIAFEMLHQLPKGVDTDIAKLAAEMLIELIMLEHLTVKETHEWTAHLGTMLDA
jgi:hypothetical protein